MNGKELIGRAEVVAAYNIFLGREPESADVIERHVAGGSTRTDFLAKILKGPEFYKRNFRALSRSIFGGAPPSNAAAVQSTCEEAELARLFEHVQDVWSKLGRTQPHYSVLSVKEFRPDAIARNVSTFNLSGRQEVAALMQQLSRLGLTVNPEGCAVELGSGVGRVTRFLAERFEKVVGYDVSEPHLALAADYLASEKVGNVDLQQLSKLATADFAQHDFFYSKLVLQHNPPPVMAFLLDRILSRTNENGIVVFQIPTAIRDYTFQVKDYLASCSQISDMEVHCLPQAHVFQRMLDHGIVPVEVYRDGSLTGFDNVSMTFIGKKSVAPNTQ